MTLSNKQEQFDKRFFLADLFSQYEADKLDKVNARKLWVTLAEVGIYLNPNLEKQYLLQRACFFCSGEIVTKKADEGNYEEVCGECGYMYEER